MEEPYFFCKDCSSEESCHMHVCGLAGCKLNVFSGSHSFGMVPNFCFHHICKIREDATGGLCGKLKLQDSYYCIDHTCFICKNYNDNRLRFKYDGANRSKYICSECTLIFFDCLVPGCPYELSIAPIVKIKISSEIFAKNRPLKMYTLDDIRDLMTRENHQHWTMEKFMEKKLYICAEHSCPKCKGEKRRCDNFCEKCKTKNQMRIFGGTDSSSPGECIICMETKADILFVPCGHFICCSECLKGLLKKECPVCQKGYKHIMKLL